MSRQISLTTITLVLLQLALGGGCQGPELSSAGALLASASIVPKSTASLVKEAGYIPQVFNVPTSQKGYVINLVRIVNPLIRRLSRNKFPVLFVHGLVENAKAWLVMGSSNGKPHDWSRFNETSMSEKMLQAVIRKDRPSRSLPFLLANFGYDVYMMNRRNTRDSRLVSPKWYLPIKNSTTTTTASNQNQTTTTAPASSKRAIELSKLDPINVWHQLAGETVGEKIYNYVTKTMIKLSDSSYFNYSYDEQVHDLRDMIQFIRAKTRQAKVDIVGHSAGGLLTIMMLSSQPETNSLINHAALLAPSVNLHYDNLKSKFFQVLESFELLFSTSIGTINGVEFILAAQLLSMVSCLEDKARGKPCVLSVDEALGFGSSQWDVTVGFGALTEYTDDSSLHEVAQLIQSGQRNQIHFNDFRDPERNALVYGSLNVPKYNLTAVTLDSMSIWQGNTDRLVNQFDTFTLLEGLKNSWDYHFVGDASEQILFNHLGFMLYENVTNIFNIPLLKRLAKARFGS